MGAALETDMDSLRAMGVWFVTLVLGSAPIPAAAAEQPTALSRMMYAAKDRGRALYWPRDYAAGCSRLHTPAPPRTHAVRPIVINYPIVYLDVDMPAIAPSNRELKYKTNGLRLVPPLGRLLNFVVANFLERKVGNE